MHELRRLHPGAPELRRLLHALVLQGTAQRAVRRLPHGRNLRGAPRAALHLEPGLLSTLAAGEDPRRFAHVIVPPRDWRLDRTNALANRLAGLDNVCKRQKV